MAVVVVMAAALSAQSLLVFLQASGHAPSLLAPIESQRVNGLFLHVNILAGYLVVGILLLTGVAAQTWSRTPVPRPLLVVPIFLGLGALATTLSRGALLGLAAGVAAIMGLMIARRQVLPVLGIGLAIVVTLIFALPQVPVSQRQAFLERIEKLNKPGSESGRHAIWTEATRLIADHPLTGIGPFGFRFSPKPDVLEAGLPSNLYHAHNVAFEGYLALGPLGLAGFIALAWGAIRALLLATRASVADRAPLLGGVATGMIGAFASMLVQGMVDFIYWQVELLMLLFLMLGAAYAIGAAADRVRGEPAPPP